jgi:hypothetical protein
MNNYIVPETVTGGMEVRDNFRHLQTLTLPKEGKHWSLTTVGMIRFHAIRVEG